MSEARAQTIWRHVHAYIARTGTSWPSYAAEVRARYEASVPEPQRRIEFSGRRDVYERMRLDAQTLRRFEGECRHGLPADLEEACVDALPEPWRGRLLARLAARYGLLAAPIPPERPRDQVASVARLLKEASDVTAALAPAMEDGRIDERDRAHAGAILTEIGELEAQLAALKHQLQPLAADRGKVVGMKGGRDAGNG